MLSKILTLLLIINQTIFAETINHETIRNIAFTWVGFVCLFLFIVGYYFAAFEKKYNIDKSKPMLFVGVIMFILVGIYYFINDLDLNLVNNQLNDLILGIAGIFFFLIVAMTYIESLVLMGVFDRLRYKIYLKGYTYKQLFWLTGIIAFFFSPIAENLIAALILATVLITVEKSRKDFLVPSAINIVVATNAGGVWSGFGDITTIMAWEAGKGTFVDFIFLLPSSLIGYIVTAYFLSRFVPNETPCFEKTNEEPKHHEGAKVIISLGILTIILSIIAYQVLHLSTMWGMMFGLSLLNLYSYWLKIKCGNDYFNVFRAIAKIENNTLLFFFGILSAGSVLYFTGWLMVVATTYESNIFSFVRVGFLSAFIDNIPVMSSILKANPTMTVDKWMLVTLTAGIGGSILAFGSAAGIAVMGKLYGIYTFMAHLRYAWTIILGYFVSIAIWYLQYEVLGWYIK